MNPLAISGPQCCALMGGMHRNTFRSWAKKNGLEAISKTRIPYFKIEDFAKLSGLSVPAIEHQIKMSNLSKSCKEPPKE